MAGRSGRLGILPIEQHADILDQLHKDSSAIEPCEVGCQKCGEDDDHANLLLCEGCNDEYHTYCLNPPLRSVPVGDFFCEHCHKLHQVDDGLESLVSALPPPFTSRFGEIVWAAGGQGFGWWPACIYDPRLTVGGARQLARKYLGKKHLVYFFECHDAPFTVLAAGKLVMWREGLLEGYDSGKSARSQGKNRFIMFEQALQSAKVEHGKPMDDRLEWNHPKSLPTPAQSAKQRRQVAAAAAAAASASSDNAGSAGGKKKRKPPESAKLAASKKGRNISGKEKKSTDEECSEGQKDGQMKDPATILAESLAAQAEQVVSVSPHTACSQRTNLNAAMKAFMGPGKVGKSGSRSSSVANEIEHEEAMDETDDAGMDGELYCRLVRKGPGVTNEALYPNVGFITLKSRKESTFSDARRVAEMDLDEDCLPSTPRQKWKFYVSKLGPVSVKQEKKLGPMLTFLRNATGDRLVGNGTIRNPLRVVIECYYPAAITTQLESPEPVVSASAMKTN